MLKLERWLDSFNPCVNARLCLVVFVDIIKSKADKLVTVDSLAVIEGITVGRNSWEYCGTGLYNGIVEFFHSSDECVGIALGIATTEEGYSFASKSGTLQHLYSVIPIVLHLACSPCGSAEDEIVVVVDGISTKACHIDSFDTELACN